MTIIFTQI